VFIAVALPLRGNPPGDAAEKDKRLLQGEWVATRADAREGDGPLTKVKVDGSRLTFLNSPDRPLVFDVDPTKSPKEINCYEGKKLLHRGIYEFSGTEVKLALSVPVMRPSMKGGTWIEAGERPQKFEPAITLILHRQKGK
jgi:uncharacterized protein (TIGR03067 family)